MRNDAGRPSPVARAAGGAARTTAGRRERRLRGKGCAVGAPDRSESDRRRRSPGWQRATASRSPFQGVDGAVRRCRPELSWAAGGVRAGGRGSVARCDASRAVPSRTMCGVRGRRLDGAARACRPSCSPRRVAPSPRSPRSGGSVPVRGVGGEPRRRDRLRHGRVVRAGCPVAGGCGADRRRTDLPGREPADPRITHRPSPPARPRPSPPGRRRRGSVRGRARPLRCGGSGC